MAHFNLPNMTLSLPGWIGFPLGSLGSVLALPSSSPCSSSLGKLEVSVPPLAATDAALVWVPVTPFTHGPPPSPIVPVEESNSNKTGCTRRLLDPPIVFGTPACTP